MQTDTPTDRDSDSVSSSSNRHHANSTESKTRQSLSSSFEFPRSTSEADVSADKSGDFSLTSGGQQISLNKRAKRQSRIGSRETRLVKRSKYGVWAVLGVACVVCAVLVNVLSSNAQDHEFVEQFGDYAHEIVSVSAINTRNIFAAVHSMGVTITSFALDSEDRFPFVTVPHFEFRGNELLQMSGAQYLSWNVIIPANEDLQRWRNYTQSEQKWIQEGLDAQGGGAKAKPITPYIFQYDAEGMKVEDDSFEAKLVRWQVAPAPEDPTHINENLLSTTFGELISRSDTIRAEVLSELINDDAFTTFDDTTKFSRPQSYLAQPVYQELTGDSAEKTIAGYLVVLLPWDNYFRNVVPEGVAPLRVVLSNTCGQTVTFEINGPQVHVVDVNGDDHESQYESLGFTSSFYSTFAVDDATDGRRLDKNYWCTYEYTIYPTKAFEDTFKTSEGAWYTFGVVLIFFFTSAVFTLYDIFVTKRQRKIEESAARSNAIVQSLFPAQVRDRLMQLDESKEQSKQTEEGAPESSKYGDTAKNNLSLDDDENAITDKLLRTKPIADLFPNATVMFADISGFTAWSSVREPSQVFTLLEQIYNSFDILARKRRIFKVETIGDCYVAAAGLPDPRPDHAIAMARFANECLVKMHSVVKKLEVRLGPDTAELGMRFGLHSGPVTAGVLRGEKSRFQLFGDTVNTASRIETTGERNRVHLSEDTAKLLIESGKESWIEKRDGLVAAKGKGEMQTYWLTFSSGRSRGNRPTKKKSVQLPEEDKLPTSSGDSKSTAVELTAADRKISLEPRNNNDDRKQRLIEWNVDVLSTFLKKILAMRSKEELAEKPTVHVHNESWHNFRLDTTVLDEVQEIIALPQEEHIYQADPHSLELDATVLAQLREYVGLIASMYQDNSFHNFEHASHVTQSVTKLLSRIVTSDDIDYDDLQYKKKDDVSELHKHTYGITSDPITQLACAFSALIHDVDHTGVPNSQLVKEESEIALFYKNKSVAEQNSVDLAWSLLMESDFDALRSLIYRDEKELKRFRQLVVNSVMATDIADKELGAARKARWSKAFQILDDDNNEVFTENPIDAVNRKATIVIEHLIQASDVSHTMQHWHVYVKWNEKLFHEMYHAYKNGRADKDPAEYWHKGELGFFDFYIIPLAKKLKECGVFGVASDEYLNYALANRNEWERKGNDMVKKYLYSYEKKQQQL